MNEAEKKALLDEATTRARQEVREELSRLQGEVSDLRRKIEGASLYMTCDGGTLKASITWGG